MTAHRPAEQAAQDRPALRGGMLSVMDQGLVSGCSFATMVAAGRANGAEGLGAFALALSLVVTAGVAQGALLSKSYVNLHRNAADPRAFAGGALLLNIGFAGVSSAALGLFAWLVWLRGDSPELAGALLAGAAAMPFVLVRDWLRQYLFAHLELRGALAFDAAWVTLQLGGVAWLYALGRLSPEMVFAPMGLAALAVGSMGWLMLRERFAPSASAAQETWRQCRRFGSWTALSELFQQSRVHLVQWLLLLLHGLESAGVFAAAMALVRVVNPLLLAISNFSEPYLAEAFHSGGVRGIRELAPRIALVAAAAAAPLCGLAAWQGPGLVQALFGGLVAVDGPVFGFLMGAAVLGLLVYPFSAALYAAGQPKIAVWVRGLALGLAGASALALTPEFGAWGAALSVLLSAIAAAVMILAAFVRWLRPIHSASEAL
jgi:O-antigen/teichoic acid export membrane protein